TVVTVIGVIAAIFTFGVSAALAVGADVADAAAEGIAVGLDAGEAGEAAESAATGLTVGEKVGVGALNVASGTLLGAGTGGVQYGATHNGFNGREFGEALGIGALSGAVSGGLGYGISALDGLVLEQAISNLSSSLAKVASTALRSGLESAVAALPGQVISNAVSHDPLGEGMLSAFGTSFAEGAAFGALDGLLSMRRVRSGPAAAHDEGAEAAAPPPPPPHDGQGNGDHDAPAAHQAEGENAQADAPGNQCRALILYRPPSRVFSPDFGLQALALQSSIPRLFRLDLPPPPPIVLDLPNARITFLDQSRFNLPPKVTVEFYTYPALTWYESGTAAGEMIH
ncbi:MAG TPA: hypothetical protein VF014_03920, partial [Casimicrobiaceae bacterium]|nr:hypothetical protein [Casimicrobiaceae bacterium]